MSYSWEDHTRSGRLDGFRPDFLQHPGLLFCLVIRTSRDSSARATISGPIRSLYSGASGWSVKGVFFQRRSCSGKYPSSLTHRVIVSSIVYLDSKAYFARIEEVNRQGPNLLAVIETSPSALKQAAALDKERRKKGARGPLHGIPILLKDNIATKASDGASLQTYMVPSFLY